MATLNFGRLTIFVGSGKAADVRPSSRVRDFAQNAYAKTGGPTQGLKRVYQAYLDNQKLLKDPPRS